MAEKSGSGNSLFSMFGGDKRIPRESFYGYLFAGATVDAIGWFFGIPGMGDLYIIGCRGLYYLNGYKTDKMTMATWMNAGIEALPLLDKLPSATAFAIWTYTINVAETSKAGSVAIAMKGGEKSDSESKKIVDGVRPGNEYAQGKSPEEIGGEGPGRASKEPKENSARPTIIADRDTSSGGKDRRERPIDARGDGIGGMQRPGALPKTFRPEGTGAPAVPQRPEVGDAPETAGFSNDNGLAPRGIDGVRDYRDAA